MIIKIMQNNGLRSLSIYLCVMSSVFLNGCSPYIYSSSTQSFNTATTNLNTYFQNSVSTSQNEEQVNQKLQFIQYDEKINISTGCSPISKNVCRVIKDGASDTSDESNTTINNKISNYLNILQGYSNALNALTNAQDRANFDKAASDLASSIGGLSAGVAVATDLGVVASPAIGGLATASTNFLLWLVGEDLDHQRLKKLKSAVDAADQSINTISKALVTALNNQKTKRINNLTNTLATEISGSNQIKDKTSSAYSTGLDNIISLAQTIQTVKDSDSASTVKALTDAHSKLKQAVDKDDDESLANLTVSLQDFSNQANNLVSNVVKLK